LVTRSSLSTLRRGYPLAPSRALRRGAGAPSPLLASTTRSTPCTASSSSRARTILSSFRCCASGVPRPSITTSRLLRQAAARDPQASLARSTTMCDLHAGTARAQASGEPAPGVGVGHQRPGAIGSDVAEALEGARHQPRPRRAHRSIPGTNARQEPARCAGSRASMRFGGGPFRTSADHGLTPTHAPAARDRIPDCVHARRPRSIRLRDCSRNVGAESRSRSPRPPAPAPRTSPSKRSASTSSCDGPAPRTLLNGTRRRRRIHVRRFIVVAGRAAFRAHESTIRALTTDRGSPPATPVGAHEMSPNRVTQPEPHFAAEFCDRRDWHSRSHPRVPSRGVFSSFRSSRNREIESRSGETAHRAPRGLADFPITFTCAGICRIAIPARTAAQPTPPDRTTDVHALAAQLCEARAASAGLASVHRSSPRTVVHIIRGFGTATD